MLKRRDEARSNYGGVMSRLGRMVGVGGGPEEYQGALTDILQRKGTFDSLNQGVREAQMEAQSQGLPAPTASSIIQEAAAQGYPLGPDEQEYLKLTLGE
jgi:hypothetical protein